MSIGFVLSDFEAQVLSVGTPHLTYLSGSSTRKPGYGRLYASIVNQDHTPRSLNPPNLSPKHFPYDPKVIRLYCNIITLIHRTTAVGNGRFRPAMLNSPLMTVVDLFRILCHQNRSPRTASRQLDLGLPSREVG